MRRPIAAVMSSQLPDSQNFDGANPSDKAESRKRERDENAKRKLK
jgi:hypothetical protein